MLGLFERQRLIRKGLASTKIRRRRSESEVVQALESGMVTKIAVFLAFIAGLATLIFYGTQPQPAERFMIGLLIFFTALAQLWVNHPNTFARNSRIVLMFGLFLVHLTI